MIINKVQINIHYDHSWDSHHRIWIACLMQLLIWYSSQTSNNWHPISTIIFHPTSPSGPKQAVISRLLCWFGTSPQSSVIATLKVAYPSRAGLSYAISKQPTKEVLCLRGPGAEFNHFVSMIFFFHVKVSDKGKVVVVLCCSKFDPQRCYMICQCLMICE